MAKCLYMEFGKVKARSAVGLKRMIVHALVELVDDNDSRLASIYQIRFCTN